MQPAGQTPQSFVQPPNQAPFDVPRSRKRRLLVIALSIAGGFLLVAISLLGAIILSSDDSKSDFSSAPKTESPVSVETETPTGEDLVDEEIATTVDQDEASDNPAGFLSNILLSNMSGNSVGNTAPEGVSQVETFGEDPATDRQLLISTLALIGITEADIAEFLLAYDTLVSDSFTENVAALTDDERAAYEADLEILANEYFISFAADCNFENLESLESLSSVSTCLAGSLNDLGRSIITISEEHGLIEAETTGSNNST